MLKVLFGMKLDALKAWFSGATRKNKTQSKAALIGFSLLMLYGFGSMGFLFWTVFDAIAGPFRAVGYDWLYFSFVGIMSFGLMFIGSVFFAKAQLFEARDNDLMLSLPIKPAYILISRLFLLWVINTALDLLVAVPAYMVWQRNAGFTAVGLAAYIVIFLFLPLLALAVAALFGWLLSLVTARLKRKAMVTTLLSLAFLGAYMVFSFRMNTMLTELAGKADAMASSLGAIAPVYMMGAAIAEGDILALLETAGLMLAAFALVYLLLERSFIKTATAHRSAAKTKYVAKKERELAPERALLGRELKRFFASSVYTMNSAIGILMAVLGAVVLLIKRNDFVALFVGMPFAADIMSLAVLAALAFCASTVLITAPSVSLEGKTLWILRSLPMDTWSLLKAKLRLHCLLSVPAMLFVSAVCCIAIRPALPMAAVFMVLPAELCVFTGLLGLAENLRHPNMDWVNETQAVKSGVGVLFSMLICWGVMVIPVAVWALWGDKLPMAWIGGGFILLILLICILLYRLLRGWGVRKFETL